METRMFGQPAMNQRGLVRCVIIENDVDFQMSGDMDIDGIEEFTKL
jgi:hypothetical protein